MQKVKLRFKIQIFFFLFALFTLRLSNAHAAEFLLESGTSIFGVGDEFLVTLRGDTEGESLNAFEGKVVFPEELLELKGVREKGSIVNLWVKEPPLFSGLTPGGYQGKGVLFSLIFEAKQEGQGTIRIDNGRALLSDGKGTPTELSIINYQFSI